jgi:2-dehydropantoate 2-reductase
MIAVVGAGAIGCYVGGRLAAAGADVVMVGRERIATEVRTHGLHLTDLHGADLRVAEPKFVTDVAAVAGADLVLVTVKSAGTPQIASELAQVLTPEAVVVSLQNGLRNAQILTDALGVPVLAAMVPFNVVHRGEGAFHQGSEGSLEVAADLRLEAYAPSFANAGLALDQRSDMDSVLWAKLLLNLNNSINALSGLPLKEELSQRAYRTCLSLAQSEALGLMKVAGIHPTRLTPLPAHWIPTLLRVPDPVFRRLASSMLEIDPIARSSMADDLELGRLTEIDYINGEVLRLAEQTGGRAPINARLIALIRDAETGGRRSWSGPDLLAELRRA